MNHQPYSNRSYSQKSTMRFSQKLKILLFGLFFPGVMGVMAQHRCSFDTQWALQVDQDPQFLQRINELEKRIQAQLNLQSDLNIRTTYQIPVVFHILWNTDAENLSDEAIATQLEILNKDFTGQNADLNLVPPLFKPLATPANIEFCLASIDPSGVSTSGITRTRTFVDSLNIGQVYYSMGEGQDAWDTDRYLNIWVANLENNLVGFGSYPGQNTAAEDGVVIDYRVFGLNDHPRLNLGRTLTHEVGHYFGLFHPWGDGVFNTDCSGDDRVPDTPLQARTFSGQCPDGDFETPESCGSTDMYMNFMNYTNDLCLHMFTKGQQLRMLATLFEMRSGLLSTTSCSGGSQPNPVKDQVRIGPNPTRSALYISSFVEGNVNARIEVFQINGQAVYRFEQDGVNQFFSHTMSTAQWSLGTYLLRVKIGDQVTVQKVLKY